MALRPISPTPSSPDTESDALLARLNEQHSRGDQHTGNSPSTVDPSSPKSLLRLVLLTLVIGGLQTAWTVELGSITPFLQELGLSKALLSLVWIAGPLSGTLVQPWVGIQSDNCRSRLGRRRPYMLGGVLATSVSLIALAWTREIVDGALEPLDVSRSARAVAAQVWAVTMVYVLDFAINTIQAAIRSFIVDVVPEHQQEQANAVAGVVTALGAITGFMAGQSDLTGVLGWISRDQFQILCVIACVAMAVTLAISCVAGRESDPSKYGHPTPDGFGVISFFRRLYRSIGSLPPQVKTVCIVEVFAWIGYFPFLFYTSSFIGNIYVQPFLRKPGHKTKEQLDDAYAEGTRRGTHALLAFSISTLAFSVLLPMLVTTDQPSNRRLAELDGTSADDSQRHRSFKERMKAFSIKIPGLNLRRAWILGHLTYAILMWATLFATDTDSATALVALAGFPWAVTQWAPFAFIAREISHRNNELNKPQRHAAEDHDTETQAGIVLGIHNVAVAAPQVLSSLMSSVVFKLMQKPRGVAGDESIEWVFRIAGLFALLAAWWTRNIR